MTSTEITTEIINTIKQTGGTNALVRREPQLGIACVRFKNSIGFIETRYGFSDMDLLARCDRYLASCTAARK